MYPAGPTSDFNVEDDLIFCSIVSTRTWTAPNSFAKARATVVFPVPGKPPKIISIMVTPHLSLPLETLQYDNRSYDVIRYLALHIYQDQTGHKPCFCLWRESAAEFENPTALPLTGPAYTEAFEQTLSPAHEPTDVFALSSDADLSAPLSRNRKTNSAVTNVIAASRKSSSPNASA
jgi:hypothetical protein